jgi:hypothetical protein
MSHNVVSELKQKLTRSKLGKQFAFNQDLTSKVTVLASIVPQMEELSSSLFVGIGYLYGTQLEAICRGTS